ncbi:hypothetical protein PAXRUDRAFT_830012 [Paxillus rubicundulus Ve08.2h10]|uniref:Uncharacterized protein n=1 Tax=Paxillus rubicundulus Ve08.2h10 TaxID=930991 RepID=A0A0D0D6D2_9AGAM|nr:hypothetical protein PAXRUDRAFT_830012 [Paxillus rubicundulus Ve08.2h10]
MQCQEEGRHWSDVVDHKFQFSRILCVSVQFGCFADYRGAARSWENLTLQKEWTLLRWYFYTTRTCSNFVEFNLSSTTGLPSAQTLWRWLSPFILCHHTAAVRSGTATSFPFHPS